MKKKIENQLTKEQIQFITNKVNQLKSYDAVCKHYNLKDLVCSFAKDLARRIYFEGEIIDYKPIKYKLQRKGK